MFKNQPKGLIGAALANMGERFGFYTMMAILVLFLQTKFNLDNVTAGYIYSAFYFGIYMLALLGGVIADRTKKYKTTILTGIILMAVGYFLLAIPSETPVPEDNYTVMLTLTCFALFVIAFGNGLFKGNLQAIVGQMYDNEKYSKYRDAGFQLFYMFINVGAIFAPIIGPAVRNWWVEKNGFVYDSKLPDICNKFLSTDGAEGTNRLTEAAASMGHASTDLVEFANSYLNVFTTGFHYAFATAIGAMIISIAVYLYNQKKFPNPADKKIASSSNPGIEMSAQEIKQRIYALLAVFAVVIFFWFSFHQNGLTLTYFARDFVNLNSFEIFGYNIPLTVESFQAFNPFFVVLLTPIIIAVFGWLSAKGIEPSTPKKIAIGMLIAALGFVVVAIGSIGLPSGAEASTIATSQLVTPWLLIGAYLVLTVAELFISPLGISFVSKVAPPKYQGLMQGAWLGATAIGNALLVFGAIFYESLSMTMTWSIFVAACLISMFTMFAMVKWLERVSK